MLAWEKYFKTIYMCVCIYIHTHTYTRVYIYTHVYTYIYAYTYSYIHLYRYIYTYIFTKTGCLGSHGWGNKAQLRKSPSKRFSFALDLVSGRSKIRTVFRSLDLVLQPHTTWNLWLSSKWQEWSRKRKHFFSLIGVAQLCCGGGVSGHHRDTVLVGWS